MTTNRATTYLLSGVIVVLVSVFATGPATAEVNADARPSDPVEAAEEALGNAEFERLVPLLQSTVETGDHDRVARAHLLFALGLVSEARADDSDDDRELIDRADDHIDQALDHRPDIEVDPLVYPLRFITRVEERRSTSPPAPSTTDRPQVFYFERYVETRSRLPLFLPGGVGQFYNGATFRGVTFASIQGLGLATNALAYWMIESMRTSSGSIRSQDIDRARGWRRAQFAGVGVFVAGWILGSIEAHLDFDAEVVRIRTLDGPPPELETFPDSSAGPDRPLGIHWQLRF